MLQFRYRMLESTFSYLETLIQSDLILVSAFAVWLVTFLAGENGGLLSIFMAFQDYVNLSVALVFTFLGSLSADLFWYFTTTMAIGPMLDKRKKKKLQKGKKPDDKSFFLFADKHPYLLLIFIKFMVGVRLVLTVYVVAKHKIPFYKYLFCNLIANFLFVTGLYLLVWSLHESLDTLFGVDKGISTLLTTIFIVVVAGNVIFRFVQQAFLWLIKHFRGSGSYKSKL